MRQTFFFLFVFIPLLLSAQVQKERRVYYLDCSYSMVQMGINKLVCDNLKNAIDQVEDPTTELLVVPFAFDDNPNAVLSSLKEYATPQGKLNLKTAIDKIGWKKATMTYLKDPIEDFYRSQILDDGITYMFLMTDGQDEYKQDPSRYLKDLNEWNRHIQGKDVYGFYVMLNSAAKNSKVEQIVNEQAFFWVVETANVNIKLARVPKEATYNIRNEKCLCLPIQGKSSGFNVSATTDDPVFYVTETILKDDMLQISFKSKFPLSDNNTPQEKDLIVKLSAANQDPYAFWLTDELSVTIKNKKEPTLKIRME